MTSSVRLVLNLISDNVVITISALKLVISILKTGIPKLWRTRLKQNGLPLHALILVFLNHFITMELTSLNTLGLDVIISLLVNMPCVVDTLTKFTIMIFGTLMLVKSSQQLNSKICVSLTKDTFNGSKYMVLISKYLMETTGETG